MSPGVDVQNRAGSLVSPRAPVSTSAAARTVVAVELEDGRALCRVELNGAALDRLFNHGHGAKHGLARLRAEERLKARALRESRLTATRVVVRGGVLPY